MKKCESIQKEKLDQWKLLQEHFKINWASIKNEARVEVHIPSLSFSEIQRNTMEKFIFRQNIQLARIQRCRDPNVKIIQLLPQELSEDVFSYYWKIFELENISKDQSKVSFFVPNHADKFPSTFALSTVLQYSDKTIKNIQRLCEGKNAQIVSGYNSSIDQRLAVRLNLPMYSGDPNKNMLYSTKSGSKRIFNIAEIPIPPSAFDIQDEVEFYTTLTRLVATNIFVNRWIFKIDQEFRGRGTAQFDTHSIKIIEEMRKKKVDYSEAQVDKLYESIRKFVPKRTQFSVDSLYKDFKDFLMDQVRVGGIIEAVPNSPIVGNPSFSFDIQPDGTITLINSYEKVLHQQYVSGSGIIPQSILTELDVQALIASIGHSLYKRDIFGFVSVDFVAFKDPNNLDAHPLFWAVDLDIFLTDTSCIHMFQDFLLNGKFSSNSSKYEITRISKKRDEDEDEHFEKRSMIQIPQIYSRGLTFIQQKTFFHMCRLENISQDLETKLGTIFLLSDSLQGGSIGLICIGSSKKECLKFICTAINFIKTQTSSKQDGYIDVDRDDKLSFTDLASCLKMMVKKIKD